MACSRTNDFNESIGSSGSQFRTKWTSSVLEVNGSELISTTTFDSCPFWLTALVELHCSLHNLVHSWVHVWCFCSTMTSWWARWRLKSHASRLFTEAFIQAQIKENIKAHRWPVNSPHKWPVTRPVTITSSWYQAYTTAYQRYLNH